MNDKGVKGDETERARHHNKQFVTVPQQFFAVTKLKLVHIFLVLASPWVHINNDSLPWLAYEQDLLTR